MRRLLNLIIVCLPLVVCSTAHASPPSPANSTVQPCLVFCPNGDFSFEVTVRDIASNPMSNSLVVLDFSQCPSFQHCVQGAPYTYDEPTRTVRALTAATGKVNFALKMGGVCPGSLVRIFADGVLLARRSLASPDRDGNLEVRGADIAAINALVGTTDETADLNCSGAVEAADVTLASLHQGDTCFGVVDVLPRSWGVLKLHYR